MFARYDRVGATVRRGDVGFNERLYMVDDSFIDIFDFEILDGRKDGMFSSQDHIVLTRSSAERYFGQEDPIGQTMIIEVGDETRQFVVSGLLEDTPLNSSLQFEFLIPFSVSEWLYPERMFTSWFNVSPETYILFREGASIAEAEAKMKPLFNRLLADRIEPDQYSVGFQPLLDIRMNPDFPQGYSTVINPFYVQILLGIAILVLAIACINFVMLSVGRAHGRAREIGVRKVFGAQRTQLMGQYWGEAVLMTAFSLVLGIGIAYFLLPGFNDLASRSLEITFTSSTLLLLGGLFVSVSLLAGLYPAVVLSSFNPVDALHGNIGGRGERSLIRKGLVIAQFSLSIFLMVGTIVMGDQLGFLQDKDLGFDKESVLIIPTELRTGEAFPLTERLRLASATRDDIVSLSAAIILFDADGWGRIGFTAKDGDYKRMFVNVVEWEFVKTMGLRVVEGRDFDRNRPGDYDRAIIINEAMAAYYGWENPLEAQLDGDFVDHEIIGVVDDFHYTSLHTEIMPAMMSISSNVVFSGANDFDYAGSTRTKIIVRIAGTDTKATIDFLRNAWAEIAPDLPFDYSFVDDEIAAQYREEERLSSIISLGSLLTLFIAGLGLFGLAALSAARRTKEIGLRKVLGASVPTIVRLFVGEFSLLVGIAFVLSIPVAWIGIQTWLEGFAYPTSIGVLPFVLAGVGALVVMWIAVGAQSFRAAVANPVDALRDE